jgi:hypothetical protein
MQLLITVSSAFRVWRIEHSRTGLGPYEHEGQIPEVVNKGLRNSTGIVSDIDTLPKVKLLLRKYPHAVFGFNSYEGCMRFVRNMDVLKKHGFAVVSYQATPLFVASDGQVLFVKGT